MYMNSEQEKLYNRLNDKEKEAFRRAESMFPNLDFSELYARAVKAVSSFETGLTTSSDKINTPTVQKGILVKTAERLESIAPQVWNKVKSVFSNAIDRLNDLIVIIGDKIDAAIDWASDAIRRIMIELGF